jgi:hypothetical protein
MDHDDAARRARTLRSAALQFVIATLGLAAIVGSGGGGLGSVCDVYPDSCGPQPPPPPSLAIDPPSVTVQVGSAVTFIATVANGSGSYSYRWARSADGGTTFVEIPGATASTYSLASVNLADDGAVFMARAAQGSALPLVATARLAVSATPGIVFSDGQFLASPWQAAPAIVAGYPSFAHSEEQVLTDGHPDAFRRMTAQVAPGSGVSNVSHLRLASTYDPAVQGAIRAIDYAEDCIQLDATEFGYVESTLFIEQLGRRYFGGDSAGKCVRSAWTGSALYSLGERDFHLFDGAPCGPGESCPDFSATGAPLRFGYLRRSYGAQGEYVMHGIDNWKVTVWRR